MTSRYGIDLAAEHPIPACLQLLFRLGLIGYLSTFRVEVRDGREVIHPVSCWLHFIKHISSLL